jgi:hypothetical protein
MSGSGAAQTAVIDYAGAIMQKSIYLINPDESGPSFHGAEVIEAWGIGGRTANVTDLSTTTVAALVPANWVSQSATKDSIRWILTTAPT